jgi:hypothetical protein
MKSKSSSSTSSSTKKSSTNKTISEKNVKMKHIIQACAGFSWTFGYLLHVLWAFKYQLSGWPLVHAAYCLAWEIVFTYVGYLEIDSTISPVKFVAVVLVNLSWGIMDFCLITLTILYGNTMTSTIPLKEGGRGVAVFLNELPVREELGLFHTNTVQERIVALFSYTVMFLIINTLVCLYGLGARRFIKYHSFAMIMSIVVAMARLPLWKNIDTLQENWYLYGCAIATSISHFLYWVSKSGTGSSVAEPEMIVRSFIFVFAICVPIIALLQNYIVAIDFNIMRIIYIVYYVVTLFPAFIVDGRQKAIVTAKNE